MRLPESDIKAALLHPDRFVRDLALHYFADSFSRDPAIMPLVMEAIERFGWDNAFEYFYIAQNLVQTDETLSWLVGQLDGTRLSKTTASRIGAIICHADAELLAQHEARLADCKWLDGDALKAVRDKIHLLSIPGDDCWKELEAQCERHKDDSDRFDFDRANRLSRLLPVTATNMPTGCCLSCRTRSRTSRATRCSGWKSSPPCWRG
jgi:hypothetical protein